MPSYIAAPIVPSVPPTHPVHHLGPPSKQQGLTRGRAEANASEAAAPWSPRVASAARRRPARAMADRPPGAPPPMPPSQHISPSRRDGMSAHDEKQRRRKTCFFIDECGVRLQLPKLPVMTAQCFFHKFFARESFRRHDRFVVAQACLFLAAKVEESAVSLRSLVRECHGVRYAGKSRAPLDESSERDVKRAVVMAERAVLYARRGVSFRPSLRAGA